MDRIRGACLAANLRTSPRQSPKKNRCQTRFGQVELAHSHRFKAKTNGFFITPYLQELMALAGASDVYSASNDLFKAFLGMDISATQIYRVSSLLGHQIELDLQQPVQHPDVAENEVIYGSMDGSMIFTDDGWQEVKVGRIFSSEDRHQAGQKGDKAPRFKLSKSTYCAHLGTAQEFIPAFEASLGTYQTSPDRLVFITDGAVWIQHYLEQTYPLSTHILDYYHAVEHLAAFSRTHFKQAKMGTQWLEKQRTCLLEGELDEVLSNLAALEKLGLAARQSRDQVVGYYGRNRHRMQYSAFRAQGLQIGSGPMEAAHRTLIQCRMKRSGQRWSDDGAQAMLNLRVAFKSGRWELVKNKLSES